MTDEIESNSSREKNDLGISDRLKNENDTYESASFFTVHKRSDS